MELVQLLPHLTCLADVGTWSNLSQIGIGHFSLDWIANSLNHGFDLQWVLAQQFDTDVFAATRRTVSEFVASGKLWTLLIGIVIGYILKSVTSYG
jgi:hypothetical protein